jgi:hypothetical protein
LSLLIAPLAIATETLAINEPYLVSLSAGSRLVSISDGKEIFTERQMFVYVLEKNFRYRDTFWVYDNQKIKKYTTSAFNITKLDTDLRILPKNEYFNPFSTINNLEKIDHQYFFQSSFTVFFEQIAMVDLATSYAAQRNSANSTRFELRTQYHAIFPVQFGFNLNFQSMYMANSSEQINLSLLSFGPSFGYELLKTDHLKVSLLAGAEYAPFAQSKSSTLIENFYAYSYDFGVETQFPGNFGNFTFGTQIRNHVLLLKNTTRPNADLQTEFKLSAVSLSIGYKLEWEL